MSDKKCKGSCDKSCKTDVKKPCGSGCECATKVAKPTNHHKRWSENDDKFLMLNYAARVSVDLIAQALNRTPVSVLHRLTLSGLVEFDRSEKAYYSVRAKLYQFPE
jgi:hypothetical protein